MKRSPLRRHTPLAPVNRKRRPRKRTPSDFARVYGSRARVKFVKGLPCVGCGQRHEETHNHHIKNGGISRKADHDHIVPLCPNCHWLYHEYGREHFPNVDWEQAAAYTESLWQAQMTTKRPAAAKTTKASKDVKPRRFDRKRDRRRRAVSAPRCELCGRHEVKQYGLCTTCLHPRTTRRTA